MMYDAISLARNKNAFAISAGFPMRPRGIVLMSGAITDSGSALTISVSVIPGATAFTRIPFGASSRERDCVRPFTAYLLAGYITPEGCPYILTIELVFMIEPFVFSKYGTATFEQMNTDFMFKSAILSYSSSV